jgi:CHAT domain-containing protein
MRNFTPISALLFALLIAAASVDAQTLRIQRYQALKKEQKWEEALATIREEIKSPALSTGTYQADLRTAGIGAVADFAKIYGFRPEMDEEVARYRKEGVEFAGSDDLRADRVRQTYGRYFSSTGRNGLALPHFRESLEAWKKRGNPFMTFISLDGIASAYGDMGELELREFYRDEALMVADDYFGSGGNRPSPNEWVQYSNALNKAMDAASRTSRERLDKHWGVLRGITDRMLVNKSAEYGRAAIYYAIAGDGAQARRLLEQARGLLADQLARQKDEQFKAILQHDFDVKAAQVALFTERYREAADGFATARAFRAKMGLLPNDLAFPRNYGRALEHLGELKGAAESYRASIRIAESARQSYGVAERAAFFRGSMLSAYHGLIRVTAREAAGGTGIGRLWDAVQAAEMVRARQLGDLVEPNAAPLISHDTLNALRASLGPTRAVLYFTLTEDQLVTLAFTPERHIAVVAPVELGFAAGVRKLAGNLSRSSSNAAALEKSLAALGETLLRPVAGLLQDRAELIVLPDGVLNLVPFDLVGLPGEKYEPLATTHRIRLVPSLRFVGRSMPAPAAKGLLAVADPRFSPAPSASGLSSSDLQAVTRGAYASYFKPLPETRTEAEAIRALFAGESAQLLLGEQATKSALKKLPLDTFSHVHFATHGILGGEVPGVGEPALVLTAEGGDEGFLTASEIAQLKLDARLSVLSACNTGSGQYVSGEGVMGLSRAFLIAGSRAVVMSLWPVDSKATEQLMVRFYTNLRGGQDPHEALRAAKLKFRDDARRAGSFGRHPYFWAPFVVFGG